VPKKAAVVAEEKKKRTPLQELSTLTVAEHRSLNRTVEEAIAEAAVERPLSVVELGHALVVALRQRIQAEEREQEKGDDADECGIKVNKKKVPIKNMQKIS
jgi:hypothetical protein